MTFNDQHHQVKMYICLQTLWYSHEIQLFACLAQITKDTETKVWNKRAATKATLSTSSFIIGGVVKQLWL